MAARDLNEVDRQIADTREHIKLQRKLNSEIEARRSRRCRWPRNSFKPWRTVEQPNHPSGTQADRPRCLASSARDVPAHRKAAPPIERRLTVAPTEAWLMGLSFFYKAGMKRAPRPL